jgi:hypothetical protein
MFHLERRSEWLTNSILDAAAAKKQQAEVHR